MKAIAIILFSLLIFLILLSLWGFYLAIHPIKLINYTKPSDFNIPYEDVSFYTEDGIKIRGWFIPSQKPHAKTIILLHGYPANKNDILASHIFLHESYNLLFFDFRSFGESEGKYTTLGKDEVMDLLAAIKYLHTRNINKVGVWGFSFGGSIALMAAPKAPEIKAIVAESSYARLDWMAYDYYRIPLLRYPLGELTRLWGWLFLHYDIKRVSPVNAVKSLKIPILLIHSKQDSVIPFNHALALENALRDDPNLHVIFTETGLHGESIKDYQKIVKDFFDKNLK